MAEAYGKLPHEILGATGLTPMRRFNLNLDVLTATRHDQREKEKAEQGNASSTGSATRKQLDDLNSAQNQRANDREAMERGAKADPDKQIEALGNLRSQYAGQRGESPDRNDPDGDPPPGRGGP